MNWLYDVVVIIAVLFFVYLITNFVGSIINDIFQTAKKVDLICKKMGIQTEDKKNPKG